MIIYTVFSLLSIPEWTVFLVYYLSVYINVYRAPEKTTSKWLIVVNILGIVLCRSVYIVFYFLGLPDAISIKSDVLGLFQRAILYLIAFWWYVIIFIPPLFAFVYLLRGNIGNKREPVVGTHKKIVCILPVYNEKFELLKTGLDELLNSSYTSSLIEIHIAFDDNAISKLYLSVLNHFTIIVDGDYPRSVETVTENGATIIVHRNIHGGKKGTQSQTWDYINAKYADTDTSEYCILLMDSDNIILSNALHNFTVYLDRYPEKIAFSGYMSCISGIRSCCMNLVCMIQDCEYISGEVNRFFELQLGSINCLPGAFTIIRYNTFKDVVKDYFTEKEYKTITEYHQNKLGEDRYLTHLIHLRYPRNCIGFCPIARCKTEPPDTFFKFIKQRRRWLLGSIANEAYMLCTPSLWAKFPLLLLYKLIQTAWRSTIASQFLVAIYGVMTTIESDATLQNIFIASVCAPLAFAWFVSVIFGWKLGHYKNVLMWPVMIVYYTFAYVFVDLYTLYTWNKKSWGGPRTTFV
jgi:chitin synthase